MLGSNSGNRAGQLNGAIDFIAKEVGSIIDKSKIYETAPWGNHDQPLFLNLAIRIESPLSPRALLAKVKSIEQRLGRAQAEKWAERLIDIDIIYFEDQTMDAFDLVIPHPFMAERRFVLVPLVEISADFIHPLLQKSNAQLLQECSDSLPVSEFTN